MRKFPAFTAVLCAFAALVIFPDAAALGVKTGMDICVKSIIPSLFPFFVVSSLMTNTGLTAKIGRALSPVSARLFHTSGCGGAAFIIGVTGGYPLGAAYVADAYKCGQISREEAERLIVFCNNSGPAFIIGAVGVGVFRSAAVGLFLYAVHILAAMLYGVIFTGNEKTDAHFASSAPDTVFSKALTEAVKSSVGAMINVCGFVVAFSALVALLDAGGAFSVLTGRLSALTGYELSYCRALLTGILELGSGIGSMTELKCTPQSLALAAFILGWGGVSVHFQSFSVIAETDIKASRYIFGRLVIAVFGAVIAFMCGKLFS